MGPSKDNHYLVSTTVLTSGKVEATNIPAPRLYARACHPSLPAQYSLHQLFLIVTRTGKHHNFVNREEKFGFCFEQQIGR